SFIRMVVKKSHLTCAVLWALAMESLIALVFMSMNIGGAPMYKDSSKEDTWVPAETANTAGAVDLLMMISLNMCLEFWILLRERNSSAADQIMAGIAKTMKEYPVDFHGARIITGQEEGAYGWMAINYLTDSFSKHSSKEGVPPGMVNTFGALDLGGESTQISFIPKSSFMKWNEVSKVTLYGYNYNIYTQSYLCYGQNEVLKRLAKTLIEESPSRTQVGHPCYPKDYRETIWLSSLYSTPCIMQNDFHAAIADRRVTLEGKGNAKRCRAVIRKLLNVSTCGQSQDCNFNGVYQPPVSGHFFAFSGFYYNFRFLNLTNGQSLLTVSKSIRNFCTRSWQDLSSSYPEEKPERLRSYCTNANYILTLLLDAYKFNETSWNNIIFQRKAGSTDVTWSLGYALELANTIPRELLHLVQRQNPFLHAAAVVFIVSALSMGLVLALKRWHR
ncbi:PREDICTED: ectonucleoside triphosphate diphosphohydrolase 8-like, partial [Tinamus guttatus]|uniref:ectonucleoside triphosphate diphosphohydrolase 8-like n=1 Tax=Tinamus guttatus TaxID=94827 RepID=UPI00052F03FA